MSYSDILKALYHYGVVIDQLSVDLKNMSENLDFIAIALHDIVDDLRKEASKREKL